MIVDPPTDLDLELIRLAYKVAATEFCFSQETLYASPPAGTPTVGAIASP